MEPGRFETGSIYIILKRLEKGDLLSSVRIETESGKIRRVYSLTDKGEATLREGLEFVIKRKRVHDELAEYYLKNFADQRKLESSSQKEEEDSESSKRDAVSKL